MTQLPTGTVTFVMTDIVGSARLWELHPQTMLRAMLRHNALANHFLNLRSGHLMKLQGEGDSVFGVFGQPTDALAAACDFQAAMSAEPWPSETPIRVRVAVHTGAAELVDGDYLGGGPNRCARLRKLCHGGQILTTGATKALTEHELPASVSLRSLGRYRLVDLRYPEQVHQVCRPDLPLEFPALESPDSVPNNLPSMLTSFVGRLPEVADLVARLHRTRILTLVGEGGSGKTRLALQLAAEVAEHFQDGVWLVDLSAVITPAEVTREVAAVLRVRETPDAELVDLVIEHLASLKLLLVLDNCELLLEPVAQLSDRLLTSCPSLKVAATSREALRCRGEMVYTVPPLSFPGPSDTAAEVRRSDAGRLFEDRAEFVSSSFQLTDHNAPLVASICRRLEGNALATELAAAHADTLSLAEIDARLFDILRGGPRTAPQRQQSLEQTIQWSYAELPDVLRRLFDRLSAFAGGWTMEAAVAVGGGKGVPKADVPELLQALVAKSMVVRQPLDDNQSRYRMHETLRRFGLRRMAEDGETDEVMECHAGYFMNLAERAEPEFRGPGQGRWLDTLDRESDNVRTALRCMREHQLAQPALRTAGALWRFWYLRGHFSEGHEQLERALAIPETDDPATPARAGALHGSGTIAVLQGDHAAGRQRLQEALDLCQLLGDDNGAAGALGNLALCAYGEGDFQAARRLYEQVLAAMQAAGNEWGVANALDNLAAVCQELPEFDAALAYAERSHAMWRRLDDPRAEASCLRTLASVALALNDLDRSEAYCERCLRTAEDLQVPADIAEIHWYLGEIALRRGDLSLAAEHLRQSFDVFSRIGARWHAARVDTALGHVAWQSADLAAARTHYLHAAELLPSTASVAHQAAIAAGLGRIALSEGDSSAARSYMRTSLEQAAAADRLEIAVDCLDSVAWLLCATGDWRRALWLAAAADYCLTQPLRHEFRPCKTQLDTCLAVAKVTVDAVEWERERNVGSTASLRDAVDQALEALRTSE